MLSFFRRSELRAPACDRLDQASVLALRSLEETWSWALVAGWRAAVALASSRILSVGTTTAAHGTQACHNSTLSLSLKDGPHFVQGSRPAIEV